MQVWADDETTSGDAGLIDAALALSGELDERAICHALLDVVDGMFSAASSWVLLHDRDADRLFTASCRGPGGAAYANLRMPTDGDIAGLAFTRRQAMFVPDPRHESRWRDPDRVRLAGLGSVWAVPLMCQHQALGVVGLDSARFGAEAPPTAADLRRVAAVTAMAAAGIRHARLVEAMDGAREADRVPAWSPPLRAGAMVGHSRAFARVLDEVRLVAPTDSTVLLAGETGTGKERIARRIHDHSARAGRPFVAVNCAALPEALVESELFGYERGAFTGAIGRKAGAFERAHRGTLFLDEVGDLPLAAQAKLLRTLQEREVQRVGAQGTFAVDVRVVAATNQDLQAAMAAGGFRADLYYRLSVFPMRMPPLRDRRDDIPLLADHWLGEVAARLRKPAPRLTPAARQRLIEYAWPGNIRELQNVLERAVILAREPIITGELLVLQESVVPPRPLPDAAPPATAPSPTTVVPFTEAERLAILRATETTGWRISGRGGAADLLGLKPTTLHAKMRRLGIERPRGAS